MSILRSAQQFVSGNICSEDLNRLRYSDLITEKTRDSFGERAPQAFVTKARCLECKIRPASILGEPSAAQKFGR